MENIAELLLALVRKGFLQQDWNLPLSLTLEDKERLYKLASAHDMAHIVGGLLDKNGFLGDDKPSNRFRMAQNACLFRYVQMQNTFEGIALTLEQAHIPFIPLKGSVLRAYYPDPTMRTSCDIDILVSPENLENAVAVLTEQAGFTAGKRNTSHDVQLYSAEKIHLELHFELMEHDRKMRDALADVWDHASPLPPKNYQLTMSNEMFVLFHIIHTAKHFVYGGCGIRPFMDLYVIQQKMPYDEAFLQKRLEEAGLYAFYLEAKTLSQVWFGDTPHTPLTRQMERYLLSGGVYGTKQNHAQNAKAKRGKWSHLWRRLFLPYDIVKMNHPLLAKWPVLLPGFYFVRLVKMPFRKKARQSAGTDLRVAFSKETEAEKQTAKMMQALGMVDNDLL